MFVYGFMIYCFLVMHGLLMHVILFLLKEFQGLKYQRHLDFRHQVELPLQDFHLRIDSTSLMIQHTLVCTLSNGNCFRASTGAHEGLSVPSANNAGLATQHSGTAFIPLCHMAKGTSNVHEMGTP